MSGRRHSTGSSEEDLEEQLLNIAPKNNKGRKAPKKRKEETDSEGEDESDDNESEESEEEVPHAKVGQKRPRPGLKVPAKPVAVEEESESELPWNAEGYIDEQDEERLNAMTELERQMEIAERVDKYEEWLDRRKLLGKGVARPAAPPAAAKTSAAEKKRQQQQEAAKQKQKQKQQMEEEELEHEEPRQTEKSRRAPMQTEESSESSSSSSEEEDGEAKRAAPSVPAPPAEPTLDDINRIRVIRAQLEKYVGEPFFDSFVKGLFVRVSHVVRGKQMYMVARIVDVVEGPKKYSLGKKVTNKALVLLRGHSKRNFRMDVISNSVCTQTEFDDWLKIAKLQNQPFPTQEEISEKIKILSEIRNYRHSQEDVERMIAERKRLQGLAHGTLVKEKASLEIELRVLVSDETADFEAINKVKEQLDEIQLALDNQRRREEGSRAISIANINKKNKTKNRAAKDTVQLKKHGAGKKKFDPFHRQHTLPEAYWVTNQNPTPTSTEPKSETPKKKEPDTEISEKVEFLNPGEQLRDAHRSANVDVDLSLLSVPPGQVIRRPRDDGVAQVAPHVRVLTLQEYKRRLGLAV